ncbi:MAG: TraR/DksA C4-type zinc finger protein [Syntrophomonadaceae bacterium]|jgi:DnaK suppressor protein
MNQQHYYQALLSRKQDIEQQIVRRRENLQLPLSEYGDELSLYDQHPGDLASDTFEREKEAGLLEMLEFELEKVNDALNNYQNGSYGVCEQCGRQIEPARLNRVVNTTLCAACARRQSGNYSRPAEEGVIAPGIMFDTGFVVAGYDYDEYK